MNTIDRYLYRTVLMYTLMAMSVLMTLGALFLFISQQNDIGVGDYKTADAFLYTFLNLPEQVFELLPIGALIGALMGLGNLAASSELVVTRASGVSVWRIAWPVGLAGATLALTMYAVGEYVAPPLAQFAKREKTSSKFSDVSFAGSSGAWVKDGNLILRVQTGRAINRLEASRSMSWTRRIGCARSNGQTGSRSRTRATGACRTSRRHASGMIT